MHILILVSQSVNAHFAAMMLAIFADIMYVMDLDGPARGRQWIDSEFNSFKPHSKIQTNTRLLIRMHTRVNNCVKYYCSKNKN